MIKYYISSLERGRGEGGGLTENADVRNGKLSVAFKASEGAYISTLLVLQSFCPSVSRENSMETF